MKIFINILALLIFSSPVQAAFIGSSINVEEANTTVVFLRQQSQQKITLNGRSVGLFYRDPDTNEYQPLKEEKSGTGFIIKYNGRDYLVTAQHVAKDLSPTGEIIINIPGNKSTVITFQAIMSGLKGARWFHHPKADISIHPMGYPVPVQANGITPDLFPKKEIDVVLLSPAVIVGFPMGLGVLDKLSPVAKEAKIASKLTSIANPEIPKGLYFYFLDQALSQGYSGSPVFCIDKNDKGLVLGVQSSAISDQTGGKISLVVPSSYIWDILESPDFQAYEKGIQK
jgi:hypothetical protein